MAASEEVESRATPPAFDVGELFSRDGAFIARAIERLTGPGPHVDDLVQETFIVAFRKRASFDGRAQPRTWVYGIAQNLARRHRRDRSRFDRAIDAFGEDDHAMLVQPGPDRDVEIQERAASVHAVLALLSFEQREVFVLYELEEFSGDAIAELVGVPVGTVWTRLHHARKNFGKLMRRHALVKGMQ